METYSDFPIQSCRYSVEQLAIYSNLVEYDRQNHNDDRDAASFVQAFES